MTEPRPDPSVDEILAEIEQKLAKITPGELRYNQYNQGIWAPAKPGMHWSFQQEICKFPGKGSDFNNNADFIAAAPRLLAAAARALRAQRIALQRMVDWSDCQCEHDTGDCCAECEDMDFHCPGCIAARALKPASSPRTGSSE